MITQKMIMATQLDALQQGGDVKRMHVMTTLQPQTVAAHSYGVAWWCWLLTSGEPRLDLIMAALQHDVAEGVVGDIPSPTKKLLESQTLERMEHNMLVKACLPDFAMELNLAEETVLKAADILDLMQFCCKEVALGNRTLNLRTMYKNCKEAMEKLIEQVRDNDEMSDVVKENLFNGYEMTDNTWRTYVS